MQNNISFTKTKCGAPSFVIIDDFVDSKSINEINDDFETFLKSINNCDFYSDNKSRKNFVSGGKYFKKFLKHSKVFGNLYDNLISPTFFNSIIAKNINVIKSKGLNININRFSNEGRDILRFSPRWSVNWFIFKLITVIFNFPFIGYMLQKLVFKVSGVVYSCALASSSGGYDVKVHTDNRYKIVVGLLYLNELPQGSGGQTLFHKYVSNANYDELSRVDPKPGRLVLFINSDDAYHSVKKYTGNIPRNFLYFSFNAVGLRNVWN